MAPEQATQYLEMARQKLELRNTLSEQAISMAADIADKEQEYGIDKMKDALKAIKKEIAALGDSVLTKAEAAAQGKLFEGEE